MESGEAVRLAERASELRLELKAWEKDFLDQNGHKASRDDIKKNREIGT